jgi:hypothetical protein
MYKRAESNTILDEMDMKLTPPQNKSKHVVNTKNVIQGHAIFRDTSPKVVGSPPSTNSKGGKANTVNKLLKNMI